MYTSKLTSKPYGTNEKLHAASSEYPAIFTDRHLLQTCLHTVRQIWSFRADVLSFPVSDDSKLWNLRPCLAKNHKEIRAFHSIRPPQRISNLGAALGRADFQRILVLE